MKKGLPVIFAAVLLLAGTAYAEAPEDAAVQRTAFTLGPVHIKEKYPSMTGPILEEKKRLGPETSTGPLWVKGFRVDVLDENGGKESSEYLCHSWVVFNKMSGSDQKMLTISEGLDEMTFPPGFAVRVDNQPDNAALLAQALNNDAATDKKLSYRLTVDYLDDAAAKKYEIKNLRTVTVAVMAKDANPEGSSVICRKLDEVEGLPPAAPGMARSVVHFDVPPGRHEYKSVLGKDSAIYSGGTIHYIKLHLHPYGESITLRDTTAGKDLWTGHVKTVPGRGTLTDVDFYSSAEGIKIDTTHDYEITSVYNNTTGTVTDAMAVLRVYVSDDAK